MMCNGVVGRRALLVLVFADLASSWSAMQAMSLCFSPTSSFISVSSSSALHSRAAHATYAVLHHHGKSVNHNDEPQHSRLQGVEFPLLSRTRRVKLALRAQAGADSSSSDSSETVRYRAGRPDDGPGLVELSMEAFQGGGFIENLITSVELALQGTDLRSEVEGGLTRRMMMLAVEKEDEEPSQAASPVQTSGMVLPGKMIGMVELGILPCPALETPYLVNLAVSRDRRREGIARALIAECERIAAEEWGFGEMFLHVKTNNRPARALYATMGFVCEFQEPMWYRLKSGQQKLRRNPRLFLRKVFRSKGVGDESVRKGGGSQAEAGGDGKGKAYVWGSEPP